MNLIQGVSDVYTGVKNIVVKLKGMDVQSDVTLILKGLGELGLMKMMMKAMQSPTAPVKEENTSHTVDIGKA